MNERVVKSTCRGCHGGCGVLITVRDNRVLRIEGDPESPVNRGTLCAMGLAYREVVHHPDRLTHPLRRLGPKGSGRWERITWDEALGAIAARLDAVRVESGAEAVALVQGTGRDYAEFLYRFANAFGTPNVATPGPICYLPRLVTHTAVCGGLPVADYLNGPRCVIVWGCNPHWTHPEEYKGYQLLKGLEGAKLVVVDPRYTTLAARAHLWLQLRPGTDAALALGMLHAIIFEDLYDKEFVERHSVGFDRLKARVAEYPPERAAGITWVPAAKIREAARLYATEKPAALNPGQVLDGTVNCVSNALCNAHLMALTGNLDAKGGNVLFGLPGIQTLSRFAGHERLPESQRAKRLGGCDFPVADWGALVPTPVLCRSILEGVPYRVRAALIHGSNPLLTWPDANRTHAALQALDFLAVADLFMTPTAEQADIVLPAASWVEQDDVAGYWTRAGYVAARQKAVQVGECRSDHEILNELGRRLGHAEAFFDRLEDAWGQILAPSGLTWEEFVRRGILQAPAAYGKYRTKGFSTPSRKYEFVPSKLEAAGRDPLPSYQEPPESPARTPELAKDYPLVLATGVRPQTFFHSEYRQVPVLRARVPEPLVELHPDTARRHGIADGGWTWIETPRGRIRMRARTQPGIDSRVVALPHAWWFPERGGPDYGWREANGNLLTDSAGPCDPAVGAVSIRSLMCRVSPAPAPEGEGRPPAWKEPERAPRHAAGPIPKGRLTLLHDRCIGCLACEVACNQEHDLPAIQSWIQARTEGPVSKDGGLAFRWRLTLLDGCDHCADRQARGLPPTCVQHCIAAALAWEPAPAGALG
ncbi:MAG TPA: molybdopterin-dependent oxidoreductase [Candidatus Methylomirabilis sp.]